MTSTIPVEAGQSRRGQLGIVWGVIQPHPRRRGFWVCASHEFPYSLIHSGRRELEELPVVPPEYWGTGREHPGIKYWRGFQEITESARRV